MKTCFDFSEKTYNTKDFQETRQQKVRTVQYGLEIALYCALNLLR